MAVEGLQVAAAVSVTHTLQSRLLHQVLGELVRPPQESGCRLAVKGGLSL